MQPFCRRDSCRGLMGQKEMGAGRQQGWDTKAKTHELRGGQMGTGEEPGRGGHWEGRGSITDQPVGAMVGGRSVPAGLPPRPVGPLHPSWSPPPHWVPPTCTCPPDPVPPGCSSPGASQHLLILSSMNPPLGPLAVTPPPGGFHGCPGKLSPSLPPFPNLGSRGAGAAGLRAAPSRRCLPSERAQCSPVLFN